MNQCENRGSLVRLWLACHRGVWGQLEGLPVGLQGVQGLEADWSLGKLWGLLWRWLFFGFAGFVLDALPDA